MLTIKNFILFFNLEFAGLLIGFYTLVSSACAFAFLTGLELSMLYFDPCQLIEDFDEDTFVARRVCSIAMLGESINWNSASFNNFRISAVIIMVFLISLAFLVAAVIGWSCISGIGSVSNLLKWSDPFTKFISQEKSNAFDADENLPGCPSFMVAD